MKLSEQYLVFEEKRELLDPALCEKIVNIFNEKYQEICNFFNYGELRKTSIVVDPEYNGVACTWTDEAKVVLNPAWYQKNPLDADSITHEWIHVAQHYKNFNPGWLTEGLADYGREKFGLYNVEGGWALPKYNEKQKYTDAYRVTAAFLIWLENNGYADVVWKLNDTLKKDNYTDNCWVEFTGKTVDELWTDYAAANTNKNTNK